MQAQGQPHVHHKERQQTHFGHHQDRSQVLKLLGILVEGLSAAEEREVAQEVDNDKSEQGQASDGQDGLAADRCFKEASERMHGCDLGTGRLRTVAMGAAKF